MQLGGGGAAAAFHRGAAILILRSSSLSGRGVSDRGIECARTGAAAPLRAWPLGARISAAGRLAPARAHEHVGPRSCRSRPGFVLQNERVVRLADGWLGCHRTRHVGGLRRPSDGGSAGDLAHVIEGLLVGPDGGDPGSDRGALAWVGQLDVLDIRGVDEGGDLPFVDRAVRRARLRR
jgi:hypothetical protein